MDLITIIIKERSENYGKKWVTHYRMLGKLTIRSIGHSVEESGQSNNSNTAVAEAIGVQEAQKQLITTLSQRLVYATRKVREKAEQPPVDQFIVDIPTGVTAIDM